ncbi:hypothetical protein LPJ66_005665 [Kickxella alabastrina]|uniref:Uncharacterized protein n=1 Tax=Kickxella alabastrina TaxID=61397 RepID=A0ACC1IDW2_9FUNG|nr:hypothetical protein LPJ66_005665 [Kickxella alabastrina]
MDNLEVGDTKTSVQQFLDGNFTTLDSLELVDELLRGAESTHALLGDELRAAHEEKQSLLKEAIDLVERVHNESLKFIDVHSEVVGSSTDENVSAWQFRDGTEAMELVSKLAAELETYERLGESKKYIDVVVDMEQAKEQVKQNLTKDPQSVLAACTRAFEILAANDSSGQGADDDIDLGTTSNLQEYTRQSAKQIWDDAEGAAASAQSKALSKLGWPGKMDMSSMAAVVAFDTSFSMLLNLDRILHDSRETLSRNKMDLRNGKTSPLPLEHMARAVDIRMRYHFESARETNRADKPEWWLSQVLSTLRSIVPFLEAHVQWLYDGTALERLDMRNEFIRLLLPIVRRKLAHDRPEYLKMGMVIAHVASELADFEHTLQEVYFFDGPSVLQELLSDIELLATWIETERSSAIKSYMDTIAEPGAFDLVYDGDVLGADDPKPSRIAENVVLIVEDIAERYSVVPSCMHQLQLLSTAQFPIIIALVEDVEAEIDEFNRISLAFIRDTTAGIASGAATATAQSSLIAQLGRLASWYQTVWYVEEAARDWNNSALYVDMWAAVCRRAQALGSSADPRDWREDCDSWGEEDRKLLDSQTEVIASAENDDWLDSGIWERSIGTLRELKQRVLDLISRAVNKDIVGQMRAYRNKSNWAFSSTGVDADNDVSTELGALMPELAVLVSSLASILPFAAFVRVTRLLADEMDTLLVERVACNHTFNAQGGRQFAKDVSALGQVLFASAARTAFKSSTQRSLPKAKECGLILSCGVDSAASPGVIGSGMVLSLEEWTPAIMDPATDSQEAMLVLKKLGISSLSLKQVRQLVKNRADFAPANVFETP